MTHDTEVLDPEHVAQLRASLEDLLLFDPSALSDQECLAMLREVAILNCLLDTWLERLAKEKVRRSTPELPA